MKNSEYKRGKLREKCKSYTLFVYLNSRLTTTMVFYIPDHATAQQVIPFKLERQSAISWTIIPFCIEFNSSGKDKTTGGMSMRERDISVLFFTLQGYVSCKGTEL
jgi:hypothetical protein